MDQLFENFNPLFEGRSGNWDVDLRNFLEFYLQELHNETSCSSMINFSQAAIVLQKSANVYERKVDYLWQLVMQLLDVVKLSKTSTDSGSFLEDAPKESTVQEEVEQIASKKAARKLRSNKPYILEEFNQINNKVSAKSLDLPSIDKTMSKTQHTLTRSAVFGRMVNIKKKRQHELYVFDKNDECMGKKDDFRLSWSLNHCCTLVEDPSDESIVNPPPACDRLDVPDPVGGILSPVSPKAYDDPDPDPDPDPYPVPDVPVSNSESPNQEVPSEAPNPVLSEGSLREVPQGQDTNTNQETRNQEVPEGTPNLPRENEARFVLPDTPPDSQQLGNGGAPDAPARGSPSEEDPAARRLLRLRNALKEGDRLCPLNYLFSLSLLQSLDDSIDENVSFNERMRAQAKRNRQKGKRRFHEVFEDDGGLAGFEDAVDELAVPEAPLDPRSGTTVVPSEESPLVPVPTPPPTPSNSQAMSPGPVSRTPFNDLPETPCRRSPETLEPINMFDPYRNDEKEQNDRSARVAAWHKSIKQRLEEANARPPFDVHIYGSKVINAFPSIGSSMDFQNLVGGMDRAEIARIFLTSLMLANTQNVEISLRDSNPLPVDCMSLTLLSTQRHEEELEAFCAPSVDVLRRSNTESPAPGTSSGSIQRKRKHDNMSNNFASNSRSIPPKKVRTH